LAAMFHQDLIVVVLSQPAGPVMLKWQ